MKDIVPIMADETAKPTADPKAASPAESAPAPAAQVTQPVDPKEKAQEMADPAIHVPKADAAATPAPASSKTDAPAATPAPEEKKTDSKPTPASAAPWGMGLGALAAAAAIAITGPGWVIGAVIAIGSLLLGAGAQQVYEKSDFAKSAPSDQNTHSPSQPSQNTPEPEAKLDVSPGAASLLDAAKGVGGATAAGLIATRVMFGSTALKVVTSPAWVVPWAGLKAVDVYKNKEIRAINAALDDVAGGHVPTDAQAKLLQKADASPKIKETLRTKHHQDISRIRTGLERYSDAAPSTSSVPSSPASPASHGSSPASANPAGTGDPFHARATTSPTTAGSGDPFHARDMANAAASVKAASPIPSPVPPSAAGKITGRRAGLNKLANSESLGKAVRGASVIRGAEWLERSVEEGNYDQAGIATLDITANAAGLKDEIKWVTSKTGYAASKAGSVIVKLADISYDLPADTTKPVVLRYAANAANKMADIPIKIVETIGGDLKLINQDLAWFASKIPSQITTPLKAVASKTVSYVPTVISGTARVAVKGAPVIGAAAETVLQEGSFREEDGSLGAKGQRAIGATTGTVAGMGAGAGVTAITTAVVGVGTGALTTVAAPLVAAGAVGMAGYELTSVSIDRAKENKRFDHVEKANLQVDTQKNAQENKKAKADSKNYLKAIASRFSRNGKTNLVDLPMSDGKVDLTDTTTRDVLDKKLEEEIKHAKDKVHANDGYFKTLRSAIGSEVGINYDNAVSDLAILESAQKQLRELNAELGAIDKAPGLLQSPVTPAVTANKPEDKVRL